MGDLQLELIEISKAYSSVVALDAASMTCEAGEVHGLVGENGAGKSTLVKILNGSVQRDSGTITLDGKSLEFSTPRQAIDGGISMVYQELSLIPDMTVGQNIFMGLERVDWLGGTSRRSLRARCLELYDHMGIHVADPDRTISQLPLSQRQMVEIAKVFARDSRVIIFDEATSALGHTEADWLMEHIRALAAGGKIIIYISHKLSEVRQISDRITVFRNGKDVGVRKRDEADIDEVVDLILGRKIGRLYPQRTGSVSDEVVLAVHKMRAGTRLKDVSFDLHRGEILGVAGLEGQGQDELFRALYGVQRKRGDVTMDGKHIALRTARDALNHGIALVPADRATQGLLLPKSVATNISLASLSKLVRFGIIRQGAERLLVEKAIDRFSIKVANSQNPVDDLSGGNQQKVLLAKLLDTNPQVLLLYDSTRGVDVGTKAEIFALLREVTTEGASVIMYSTEMEEIINMCDRVLVMRQGEIEAELTGGLISEENIVRASMGEALVNKGDASTATPNIGQHEVQAGTSL